MAMEALSVAVTLVKTIYKMWDDKTTADVRVKEMVERVFSLDQPLQVLKKNCRNVNAYEAAFNRLVDVLRQVEGFLKSMQSTTFLNQAKKWALGEQHLNQLGQLNSLLNNSLLDLQTAIQAEETERSEARVMETALATVQVLAEAEKKKLLEQIRLCVHCGQEYRESANAEGGCKYHKTWPTGGWSYTMNCCGKTSKDYEACFTDPDGCVRGKHRDVHHTDFPYANYFRWMRAQSDEEAETLMEVIQEDLEDEYEKKAAFGVRKDGSYFIKFAKAHMNLFLAIFSSEDLKKMTSKSEMVMINTRGSDKLPGEFDCSTPERKWFINAYWLLENGKITGVTLTVKSLSRGIPNSKTILFSVDQLPKFKEIKVEHDDTVPKAQKPSLPEFALDPKVNNFQPFPEHVFFGKKVKDDYPTETSTPGFKLRIKQSEKCKANPKTSGFTSDNFVVPLMLMHHGQSGGQGSSQEERLMILQMVRDGKVSVDEGVKLISVCESTTHSEHTFTMIHCKTEYQFEGDSEWTEAEFPPEFEEGRIPLEIKPRGVEKVILKITVNAKGKSGSWFDRAFISRLKPIRFRLTFEEMGGGKASTIIEFANPPAHFPMKEEKDIFFFSLDSIAEWDRYYFRVSKVDDNQEAFFKIQRSGISLEVGGKQLRLWAYDATKKAQKEYFLENVSNERHKVFALVDLELGVVYGLKFFLQAEDGSSASDSFLLPASYVQL